MNSKRGVVFTLDTLFFVLYVVILMGLYSYMTPYPSAPLMHNHQYLMTCSLLKSLYEGGELRDIARLLVTNITAEGIYFQQNVSSILRNSISPSTCYSLELYAYTNTNGSFYEIQEISHDEGCMRRNIVACELNLYVPDDNYVRAVLRVGERLG